MMNSIVQKNIDSEENTFIFLLHERSIFDTALFQEYIENVCLVNIGNTEKKPIISVIEVNDYIVRNVIYHFLPEDLFVMENFPPNMGDYIEQIRIENERLIRML